VPDPGPTKEEPLNARRPDQRQEKYYGDRRAPEAASPAQRRTDRRSAESPLVSIVLHLPKPPTND
jgi:hypothetical protein